MDDKKKHITSRVIIFILIISLLFTGALLASMFLKLNNQNTYLQATKINAAYNNFMLTIAKDIIYLRLTNI